MLKLYNIRQGIVFSLFIALLMCLQRLINEDFGMFAMAIPFLFLSAMTCWVINHIFLLNNFGMQFRGASRVRAFVSISLSVAVVFLFNNLFKGAVFYRIGLSKLRPEQLLLFNLFRSIIICGFCYFVVHFLHVSRQLQNSKLENEYLKQDQLKAQLFSLQQQLSPHFLFNSLSTLKTIAPDASTKTYVLQLANVYRYLLTFHDHQSITVEAEWAFTKSYLYILQERFEDALQVAIEIDPAFLGYYMPPLTLQILVENAIKHNVMSVDQPLKLHIYSNVNGTLTVENSYQPKRAVEESHGKGLQNIRDRYKLLAGKQLDIRQDAGLFTVVLPLIIPDNK